MKDPQSPSDVAQRIAGLSPEKRALLEKRLQRVEEHSSSGIREPIAVIGMGCRFPGGADSPDAFWKLLMEGFDGVSEIPGERRAWSGLADAGLAPRQIETLRWGGFVNDIQSFDPAFFNISPREADHMDPQQRLFLMTAVEALEMAGLPLTELAGQLAGVYVGIHSMSSDYFWLQGSRWDGIDTYTSTGVAHSIVANRLSYCLDLRGPSLAVDTACSSSLVALHLACQSLRAGECDLAVAGGVNLILAPETSVAFSKLNFLAPDGRCKVFDERADGFVRSEGCGVLVLKRLSQAKKDNDPILAVVRGSAINQDGASNGLTAPNGASQQTVIAAALRNGDVRPEDVTYIETHGTGTSLGDPIEIEAIDSAYRSTNGPAAPCYLGAVKSNIGHLEAAAGIAGLIKTVLCLHHRMIPPNIHFRKLNPNIPMNDSRLRVPTAPVDWVAKGSGRFGAVSSFGFGGTNAHVILQEYVDERLPAQKPVAGGEPSRNVFLLPLSAKCTASLRDTLARWQQYLSVDPPSGASLYDISYTACVRRTHHEFRMALHGRDKQELAEKLRQALQRAPSEDPPADDPTGRSPGNLAFVFSGQGPQWFGMGRRLFERESVYRDMIERIDSLLEPLAQWSLIRELAADEAHTRLGETEVAQPAIFALQMGLATLWAHWGIQPDAIVGHSIGEVAAACFSGVLSLKDAVRVVYHRGRLLQRAHGKGMMAAVGMSADEASALIAGRADRLTVAAINSPDSVTLSGDADALNAVLETIKARNLFCRILPVNYAFHSHHITPFQQEMASSTEGVRTHPAAIPVFSTVSGRLAQEGDFDPAYWAENIRRPVRFSDAVNELISSGHSTFLELSPQPVLNASILQCFSRLNETGSVIPLLRRGRDDEETMLEALGKLYAQNRNIAWEGLFKGAARCVPTPSYPWQMKRYWLQNEPDGKKTQSETASVHGHEPEPGDLLLKMGWLPERRLDCAEPRAESSGMPAPELIARHVRNAFEMHAEENLKGGKDEPGIQRRLDQLCAGYIVEAFQRLGWELADGDGTTAEALAVRLGVLKRHRRLLDRLLEILAQEGILRRAGAGWEVTAPPAKMDLEALFSDFLSQNAELRVEMTLLGRCARALAGVLSGSVDPLELIFGQDGGDLAEELYQKAPIMRLPNAMVRKAGAFIAEQSSDKALIRVLEIGAGTGGTTRHLLQALPGDRTEYIFSDVSSLFLEKARANFSDYPFVRYHLLDIEKDPEPQGFAPAQFDIVIAANVLHATSDLRRTLNYISRLMAPNGLMLLVEGVRPSSWVDLIFGLLEGWWKFTDTSLRPSYPLIDAAQWKELVPDLSFAQPEVIPAVQEEFSRLYEQALIVAQSTNGRGEAAPVRALPPDQRQWLLFMDTAGYGQKLADSLRSRGAQCITVFQGKEFKTNAPDEVFINPSHPEDYARLFGEICTNRSPRLSRVLHLWSIDPPGDDALTSEVVLEENIVNSGTGILRILLSLAGSRHPGNPRLWIVTRGAQGVRQAELPRHFTAATLWGLGRTAANEFPDLWGGLVDLGMDEGPGDWMDVMADHIARPDGNDQFAMRLGERYVPRVLSLPAVTRPPLKIRSDATYVITGGLGDLGLETSAWLVRLGARRLLLLNRTQLPPRSEWPAIEKHTHLYKQIAAIRDMEQLGAQIRTCSVDVTRKEQLNNALTSIGTEMWPPVRGVIHTASQFERKLLQHMDENDYRSGMRTKVIGAYNLHTQFAENDLDFFVLYSSLNSLFGMTGLASYAASNAFLDAFAHYRIASGLPAVSVNWGLWSGFGFVRKDVQQRAEDGLIQRGVESLDPKMAMEALGRLIELDIPQGCITKMDWGKFRRALGDEKHAGIFSAVCTVPGSKNEPPTRTAEGAPLNLLKAKLLAAESTEQRRTEIESYVKRVIGKLLRMEMNAISRDKPLGEFGFDSLMAVELAAQCKDELHIPVQATMAWNYPTVALLAEFISGKLGVSLKPESLEDKPDMRQAEDKAFRQASRSAGLLESVNDLSDQEVFEKLMNK